MPQIRTSGRTTASHLGCIPYTSYSRQLSDHNEDNGIGLYRILNNASSLPESTLLICKGRSCESFVLIGAVSCSKCLTKSGLPCDRDGFCAAGSFILPALSSTRSISLQDKSFNSPFGFCQPHNRHMCCDILVRFHSGFSIMMLLICSILSSVILGLVRYSIRISFYSNFHNAIFDIGLLESCIFEPKFLNQKKRSIYFFDVTSAALLSFSLLNG